MGIGLILVGVNMMISVFAQEEETNYIIMIHGGFVMSIGTALAAFYSGCFNKAPLSGLGNSCTVLFFIFVLILWRTRKKGFFKK
jgi:uncharacterized membrane protein HdeD (DUF308 family)